MKCPYCNKSVRDVPEHLDKSKPCSMKHGQKLLDDLNLVIHLHDLHKKEDSNG